MVKRQSNIGKIIKKFRQQANMTQTDLAKEVGVSKSVISAYEKGIRNPSLEVLGDIANVFNISEVEFFLNDMDDYRITIDITDLTSNQQEIIQSLVREFRFDNYMISEKSKAKK